MKSILAVSALAMVLASGCSTSPDAAPPLDAGPPPPSEDAAAPLAFGPCPEGYQPECAFLDVPLDHANPSGETIQLHIARKRAQGKATRQLWLLTGGPGQAGEAFSSTLDEYSSRMPDADIYVVDHRGVGYSHRLTCKEQDVPGTGGGYALDPSDVPACLRELKKKGDFDRLRFFTTAQAARDVVSAVKATRALDQRVYLLGFSYGTHWAHRVLQVAPDLVNGIAFDGFMTPSHFSFLDYDKGIEESGKLFAAGCTTDPSCSAHMGGDALVKTRAILEGLRTKRCGNFDRDVARIYASLFLEAWGTRTWVFPFLHRLERCSESDRAALMTLLTKYQEAREARPTPRYLASGILQYNIVLSELWNLPGREEPTREALTAAAEAQTFLVSESYPASIADLRASWPLPPPDYLDLPVPVPTTKTSLLWLAAGFDTRTPPSQSEAVRALYPTQAFVLLPGASHTPSFQSPLASNAQRSCGQIIIEHFVNEDRLDTSCSSELQAPRYESPNAEYAMKWWGTADDWGDGVPKPAGAKPEARAPRERIEDLDLSLPARIALARLDRRPPSK